MDIYILKSTAILGILWLGYILFLERENMHRFKRFYLLISIFAAICIPLITFTEVIYIGEIDNSVFFQNEIIPFEIPQNFEVVAVPFWTLELILWIIYSIGVFIFGLRFIKNLFSIITTIKRNEKISQNPITYVLLKQLINPHTFFNYIFFNKLKFESNDLPKEVILHEETHAKQKHSLDVFFIELLQVVFWFQPFIWLYKKHIKLNHEFLADQAVLNQGYESTDYQNILLQFSSNTKEQQLSSAINYSSIKKRFTVMKTQTSKSKIWLLSLLVLPVLGILFYSFSDRNIVELEDSTLALIPIQKTNVIKAPVSEDNKGASEALMTEYKTFIKKFKETNIIYGDSYERAIIIYDQIMNDTQRKNVEKYPTRIIPKPNLSKISPRKPTKTKFEAYKNEKKYAIWIDGSHVPNSKLNDYDYNDFVHVSGSHVYKDARNPKFPQPNQYHLYTKAGFKSAYQDSQINKYKKAAKIYTDAIHIYLKGLQTDNSELKILKSKADAIYKTFSAKEKEVNIVRPTPPVPAQEIYYELPESKILINGKVCNQCEMSLDEIKNLIITTDTGIEITSYSGKVSGKNTVNVKGNSANKNIENILSGNPEAIQLMNIRSGKKLIKNIVIITIKNQQNPATDQEIRAYNIWAKKLNNQISKAKSNKNIDYPIIKQKDIEQYKSIYNRMTTKQKNSAEAWPNIPPPPPPPPTKVKSYKNGKKKTLNEIIKETPKNIESGYEVLDNGESHYYTVYKGKKTYYNKDGYITDHKGNILPPPPPAPSAPPTTTKGGPNSNDIKLVFTDKPSDNKMNTASKDYKIRQLILKISNSQTKPLLYRLNNTNSNLSQIENYLLKHPETDVTFKEGKNNILSFSDKKNSKMSEKKLQSIYSNLFETYADKNHKIVEAYKINNDTNCLEVPKSFIFKEGKTLDIKCIENYPKNKFQVFNRYGNIIFSKDDYANNWDGSVDEKYAVKGSNKIIPDVYYYVFESPKSKTQADYLSIN